MALLCLLSFIAFACLGVVRNWPMWVFESGAAAFFIVLAISGSWTWWVAVPVFLAMAFIELACRSEVFRFRMSRFLFNNVGDMLPKLSKTEQQALEAGDTWLEESIFRGQPDWQALADVKTELTEEEAAFLANETEALCAIIDDWEIQQLRDLPKPVWQMMREKGFFGLVIDKAYGGKGFSARAHSDVVMKIATRSGAAAVTVMVPNSLGPGELLHHYGTDEQKAYYLPRLAVGDDIPCFALTEPGAGSDATSIESEAIVVEKEVNGEKILGLDITINKRWITLAPVATLIGLAVQLKDPKGLLRGEGEEGITCVLIPRDTPNLEIGARHIPADQFFMNGTIRGEHIFAPITQIIGGQKNAGKGWQMLVECLSIGRSISLPALGAATSTVSYLSASAYARVRRQFGVSLHAFEGIQERLAEIGGVCYLVDATRLLTVAAVDAHKKPSVASAITKYHNTEKARIALNHTMDIHGGRAVVVGPRNYLANMYASLPISITVEGANIMTRNLLIFGQGSMACHPFVRQEFLALSAKDMDGFHRVVWQHIHYFVRNFASALVSAWTGGYAASAPAGDLHRERQQLTRLSQAFAWLADASLIMLGGSLKRRERLSARLGDALANLYMAMAAIRLSDAHAGDSTHLAHAKWACAYAFYHAQKAMVSFCQNYPSRWLGALMSFLLFPRAHSFKLPSDKADAALAALMDEQTNMRQLLKSWCYFSGSSEQPLDKMEMAFEALKEAEPLFKAHKDLARASHGEFLPLLKAKYEQGQLDKQSYEILLHAEKLRWDALQVDEFSFDEVKKGKMQVKSATEKA